MVFDKKMLSPAQKAYVHALQFYADAGVDEALLDEAQDRTTAVLLKQEGNSANAMMSQKAPALALSTPISISALTSKSDLYAEALERAKAADTLEALAETVASFDGIPIKKTASTMVFADGNPKAKIMLIGEAPGAEEDREGKPFVGEAGLLLDKILASIGLSRREDDPLRSAYITNILNWRPPGNRTPSPSEVELSLPFIERHIQLVQPELLIFCGGIAAKALLGSEESISRLRTKWHDYKPVSRDMAETRAIPAIVTYHPSYLLKTPAQKKLVWADMLSLLAKRRELGLVAE